MREVAVGGGGIRLGQFLKLADLVAIGSEARPLLAAGEVAVNGVEETRRGRHLEVGDVVSVGDVEVRVAGRAGGSDRAGYALGDPGPRRDRLVAAALRGVKTAATSPEVFYRIAEIAPPRPGDRSTLVGSAGERLASVEIVRVDVCRLADVGDDVALAEGEGFADAGEWRDAREHEWGGSLPDVRAALGEPGWVLDDDSPVVVEWFRIVDPVTAGE